jgi:hypothetical protein
VVDVVKLSQPDGSTSERFRVRRHGIFVGEARTLTELGRIVDLADLIEALWDRRSAVPDCCQSCLQSSDP